MTQFKLKSLALPVQFDSVSVILPVINETDSLKKTVEIITQQNSDSDIKELIFVVCNKTTEESLLICAELKNKRPHRDIIHHQTLPFLGGAIQEAFEIAKGSHVLMMASDMETDPRDVKTMIVESKKVPSAIITASRWGQNGGFEGYGSIKLLLNWLFQKIFAFLYQTSLSDLTYGYRLFPTRLVKEISWKELGHPFLFETIIKPMRLGVKVIEVKSKWKPRYEGESQNNLRQQFEYFRIGIQVRFSQKFKLFKKA